MSSHEAFVYIDDDEEAIEAFESAVRENWNFNYEVIHNDTFGKISKDNYELFKTQIFNKINDNIDRIKCIFLDLDFSGGEKGKDKTGFTIGKEIRENWPLIPIILTTRFTELEISQKGMVFDFDNIIQPGELIRLKDEAFHGIIDIAIKKRENVIKSIGDTPVSYKQGKHLYFNKILSEKQIDNFAFIAMPFDSKIVSFDVYEFGIKEALKNTGYKPVRVDFEKTTVRIIDRIVQLIFDCKFVIADITSGNPNVMYELGVAHTINKPCIVLMQRGQDLKIPFDVGHLKTILYEKDNLALLKTELNVTVKEWKNKLFFQDLPPFP